MPTAFVTGGSGFVGGALIERLRAEGWDVADPVWWRPERTGDYRPLDDADAEALRAAFAER